MKAHIRLGVVVEGVQSVMRGDEYVKYYRLEIKEQNSSKHGINIRYLRRRFKEFYKFKQELH